MPSILMIDDDDEFSGLTSEFFTRRGYSVELATGGKVGLAKVAASPPDLIFLDIMMPDMNGIEVLRELGSDYDTAGIPVLVMSSRDVDAGMQRMFSQERNFKGFVPKPTNFDTLEMKVAGLLRVH
ncbi:MAG: response regulator receiver [Elusimicrobia bacterium]|nr:MAG: response regulator receiver [Elusimicrobiota bacterium]KAF0154610.1 MAG: response regulator receiver [Elusimicrobiota bacterium]